MFDSLKEWLKILIDKSFKAMGATVDEAVDLISAKDELWDGMMTMMSDPDDNILRPFCYTIVGICLLIEVIQTASKVDILKWEHGLKLGIKMVLAKVCIDESPTFLQACYMQALEWIKEFSTTPISFDGFFAAACKSCVGRINGMGSILGLFTICMLIFLAIEVCALVIKMTAYGRMFEIYSYLIVSPLPFAFLPLGTGDGFSINRMTSNFIKNFIASCMQGVMIIIAIFIYRKTMGLTYLLDQIQGIVDALAAALLGTETKNMEVIMELSFFMLLHAIIQVVVVTKASSLAKSMINAM